MADGVRHDPYTMDLDEIRFRVRSDWGLGLGVRDGRAQFLGAGTSEPLRRPTQREQLEFAMRFIRERYGEIPPWETWDLHGALMSSRSLGRVSILTDDAPPIAWMSTVLGADAEEAMGRRETAALMRSDAAIRLFHRHPSWRLLWLAVKWAFLSGVRRDEDVIYAVSFKEGSHIADVARINTRRN